MIPAVQFMVPVTWLVLCKVMPASSRLVMLPPWNAGPSSRVPPSNCRPGTKLSNSVSVPPVI